MKILLSAFACAPNVGSEGGVGWRWALELAKHHQVFILTDISRRPMIQPALGALTNPKIIYFRPAFLKKLPLNSHTAQMLYSLWQYSLLPFARLLHREHCFDLAIHLTYGVFRHPSFLGFLGIPFVFGPVGGGEDAPWRLKKSIKGKEKLKEALRTALNKLTLLNPFLWLAYSRAKLILVKTEDTRQALPWPFRNRAIVFPEIGIDCQTSISASRRLPNSPIKVLFAGRMIGWKGIHLAIRAVVAAKHLGAAIDFTLVGSGPMKENLHILAKSLTIESEINWIKQLPQQELFSLYRNMDCLLFPSLHDSSGNVVLEAMSFGLPVICLDLGGPKTLVNEQCATVVSTTNRSEEEVINALAQALLELANNEPMRLAMSQAAIEQARAMAWDKRIREAMVLIKARCIPLMPNKEDSGC